MAAYESRNPPWNRDELILALDAYIRWQGNPPAKISPEVADLSCAVSDLRQVLGTRGQPTLRNTNGVYMKLMNFRRFDPAFISQGKSGLSRGNQLEEHVWIDFSGDPPRLARVAAVIRDGVKEAIGSGIAYEDRGSDTAIEGEEAVEGRLITVMHQRRERARQLVEKRKALALRKHGKLECEVCAFNFKAAYGDRGSGFIECHHTKPVETLGDGTPTKLQDFALLCSNCHRMIHAKRPWLTIAELKLHILAR